MLDMLLLIVLVSWMRLPLAGSNIIMGGEGVGGVEWFVRNIPEHVKHNYTPVTAIKHHKTLSLPQFWSRCSKSSKTRDSLGCQEEFEEGKVKIFTTVVGERPGAITGLTEEGILRPVESLNLCILRGQTWAFRRGRVELGWRPNLEDMRTGRDKVRHFSLVVNH